MCNKPLIIRDMVLGDTLDFLALTETWLQSTNCPSISDATPAGFTFFHTPRSGKTGGGVAIIARSSLDFKPFAVPSKQSFESLVLSSSNNKLPLLAVIYRPPGPKANFVTDFSDLISVLCARNRPFIVLGDFNIHFDNPVDPLCAEFKTLSQSFSLSAHVHGPTHDKGHTLDQVLTHGCSLSTPVITKTYTSDHMKISFSLQHVSPSTTKVAIESRSFKSLDIAGFRLKIASSDLLCNPPSDLPSLVDCYNTTLAQILDEFAPLTKRNVRPRPDALWFTAEVKQARSMKRKLEKTYKKSGLAAHKQAYKDYCRSYQSILAKAKSSFYKNIVESQMHNPKMLMSTINHLLNRTQTSILPDDPDGNLACRFSTFFINKIDKIRESIPVASPQLISSPDCLSRTTLSAFQPATAEIVKGIISQSKKTTSPLDPIPTVLLLRCLDLLLPTITNIVNMSLTAGTVPVPLKQAIVRPLIKKPTLDQENLSNFRPVSLLPFVSKTLERVVANQLNSYIESSELASKFQSGFRANHSTESALLRVQNDILRNADLGRVSLLVLLDLSAAFDTIDHQVLFERLESRLGISGIALQWIWSYLSGRSQSVDINGHRSSAEPVKYGVPQGSVLGPLLFTIYTLPLADVIARHNLGFHFYADDTQLYQCFDPAQPSSTTSCVNTMESCIADIRSWMAVNFLKLNDDKNNLIVMRKPSTKVKLGKLKLKIGSADISPVASAMNLGI